MGREEEVREVARSGRGLVDRSRAMDLGFTPSGVRHRLAKGDWQSIHAGVYHLNVTPPDWETDVSAAVLAAGPNALASHRTAAVLFGLDAISGRMIEVTVPYTKQPVPTGVIVHRTRRRLPSEVVAGIPVTSVERTLLDLAALVPEITLEKALMSAIHAGLTSPDSVALTLSEQGRRGVRGVKKMRRVLLRTDEGITGSPSEVDVVQLLRDAPIPMPVLQHEIRLPDGGHAFPDFAWPDRMKIVEIDGFVAHGTPDQLHNDLNRQNQLLELGWEIRRFSARAVRRDTAGVISQIASFIKN